MKICPNCKLFKRNIEFSFCSSTTDKLYVYCKECNKIKSNKYYYSNLRKIRKKAKIKYSKNKKYVALKTKIFNSTPKGKILLRKNYLNVNYNISIEDYESKLKSQNYRCYLCKSKTSKNRNFRFCIDHNHICCSGRKSCGKCIRGLLCNTCNTRLGLYEKYKKFFVKDLPKYIKDFS